jgi:hypothetical protein
MRGPETRKHKNAKSEPKPTSASPRLLRNRDSAIGAFFMPVAEVRWRFASGPRRSLGFAMAFVFSRFRVSVGVA